MNEVRAADIHFFDTSELVKIHRLARFGNGAQRRRELAQPRRVGARELRNARECAKSNGKYMGISASAKWSLGAAGQRVC